MLMSELRDTMFMPPSERHVGAERDADEERAIRRQMMRDDMMPSERMTCRARR